MLKQINRVILRTRADIVCSMEPINVKVNTLFHKQHFYKQRQAEIGKKIK